MNDKVTFHGKMLMLKGEWLSMEEDLEEERESGKGWLQERPNSSYQSKSHLSAPAGGA